MAVCTAVLISSNGGPATTSTSTGSVAGTYQLQQVNGHKLPTFNVPYAYLVQGQLTLAGDGTYSLRFGWQGTTGASRNTGDDGTYTQTGSTLKFQPKEGEGAPYTGHVSAGSILLDYDFDANGTPEHYLFAR